MKVAFLTEQGSILPALYRILDEILGTKTEILHCQSYWPSSPSLCSDLIAQGVQQVVLGYPATSQAEFMGQFTAEAQQTRGGTVITVREGAKLLHDTRIMGSTAASSVGRRSGLGRKAWSWE